MGAIASQITSLTTVYSIVYSDLDQRKHLSSASLACVWGIHRGPVNYPHKWPVARKIFPFDDVIMILLKIWWIPMSFLTLVVSNGKSIPNPTFYEKPGAKLVNADFTCHLTLTILWHIHLFAYFKFDWRRRFIYSHAQFIAKVVGCTGRFLTECGCVEKKLSLKFEPDLFLCWVCQHLVTNWSYSTVCKYSKPYLRSLGRDPRDTLPYVQISFDWAL